MAHPPVLVVIVVGTINLDEKSFSSIIPHTRSGFNPMIISEIHNFAFIHIPKCAGSSVRQQIRHLDDERGYFADVKTHPVLGSIDFGHIPLHILRVHFPVQYEKVQQLDSFAICRDPLARFGSSLRQTLWMYDKRPMTLIPKTELRDLTLRVLDELYDNIDNLPHKYAFFTRQTEFVYDENERIVKFVLPIGELPFFLDMLGRRVGAQLDTGRRSNQNVELRFKSLGQLAYAVNDLIWRYLPLAIHARIKKALLPLISRKESAALALGIHDIPEVRQFVEEKYRADQDLYSMATRDFSAARDTLLQVSSLQKA